MPVSSQRVSIAGGVSTKGEHNSTHYFYSKFDSFNFFSNIF